MINKREWLDSEKFNIKLLKMRKLTKINQNFSLIKLNMLMADFLNNRI